MNLLVFLIILSAHFFSNLNIASSIDDHNQGTNIDRIALLAMKSEITHDPQGVLNNWNDSVPICQWQGVTCGAKVHRRVVSLNLVSKGLVGTLSPFVGNLSFLHHLNLRNNTFQGRIPTQIGHLLRLRALGLELNTFTGEIPANISLCLKLEALGLAKNHLSGIIPPELALLSNLKNLSLHENRFIGNLLDIVVNMTSLEILSAAFNSFQGSIPYDIGRCKNLTHIGLGDNKISGTFPTSLYNLSSLQLIDLNGNYLEGSLPLDIGLHFPQLTDLRISGNFFHGHVPVSLSNLTHLEDLEIYSNNFTGKFLFDATNIPNLQVLDITTNYLGTGHTGDLNFLQTMSNCTLLQTLLLSSNNFGGFLPSFLGNLSTQITVIDASQNQITGYLPPELFNFVNLERLVLEENQLTGYLPPEIGNLTKLEIFSCRNNHLFGTIPNSVGNLSKLSNLYLDSNNFEGAVPSTLGNCKNLLYLVLSQNNLTGSLPCHLFQAAMLVDLDLDHNHLQGTVPAEIGQLTNLVELDISRNAFTGEAPSSLGSCVGLRRLYMGENFFTGSIPLSFKSLTSIQYLNLSHNNFSGRIPEFLSNSSLMGLDLAFNNLEGEVPTTGVFRNSSALFLSGNSKLCGGIHELHLQRCPAQTTATRPKRRRRLSRAVILIIAIACWVASVSIVSYVYLICSKRKRNNVSKLGSSMREALPKVSYGMLHKATNGFSEVNLLGTGHFGSVYKGVFDLESMVVAIKVINLEQRGSSKSFTAECKALRNIRHRNLVKIITACSSTDFERHDFKALVYEFMSNGNLEQWIHVDDKDGREGHYETLSLPQRLNIAIDVACALDYLHNGCENPIIHCDLKPSNILLDDEMVAHVGDFGLARLHSNESISNTSSILVEGTVGYAAPEYGLGSMASKEGDIYSYGIVLIEMMTAVKPTDQMFEGGLNLHQYAKLALADRLATIIDPTLAGDDVGASLGYDDEILARNGRKIACIKSIIEIGVKCSVESPQERMSMEDVVWGLQTVRDKFFKRSR